MRSMCSKVCFKCGAEKPLSDFYKHKKMADGHLNKCKTCTKKDSSQHREDNLEKVKEYDRNRGGLEHRVAARREYAKTETGQANLQKAKKSYSERNPKVRKAHSAVSNAIRDGKLTRPSYCECCREALFVEAHHCDYNKPLDVLWLCDPCHKEWHKKNDPIC